MPSPTTLLPDRSASVQKPQPGCSASKLARRLCCAALCFAALGGCGEGGSPGPGVSGAGGSTTSTPDAGAQGGVAGQGAGGSVVGPGSGGSGGSAGQGTGGSGGQGADGGAPIVGCGDGQTEGDEACDDGNLNSGDGCSNACRVEPLFECPPEGGTCQSSVVCGNGVIRGSEACDDGNASAGDGCSEDCSVEPGYDCPTPGAACIASEVESCGNSVVEAAESCDDGNATGADGCAAVCQTEAGFACTTPGQPCERIALCGDGYRADSESCDDGNASPGDGCSGLCTIESFYNCPIPNQPCQSQIVCGDGQVIGDEACDDSNTASGDGCTDDCKQVEAGYQCPSDQGVGGACQVVSGPSCGNAQLEFGEACDDGNLTNGDGCSDSCQLGQGYTCGDPGTACALIEFCGDGAWDAQREGCDNGSQCTDGTACTSDAEACAGLGDTSCEPRGGDGCSAACVVEADYACPNGTACQSTVVCGDGLITGGESCEDDNSLAGDGCSACLVEDGWTCPAGGDCRAAECGDGIVAGLEECDFAQSLVGCQDCSIDSGYDCNAQGCFVTDCGDGDVHRGEQCDDANDSPFDGCYECELEPTCVAGQCQSSCGDGQRYTDEACDDGNSRDGDGCSSTCQVEPGFHCADDALGDPPPSVRLPLVLRDFIGSGNSTRTGCTNPTEANPTPTDPCFHIDFNELVANGIQGVVDTALGADGRPVYRCPGGDCDQNPGHLWDNEGADARPNFNGPTAFSQWYDSGYPGNLAIDDELLLDLQADGSYLFDSLPAGGFYPLDGAGWVDSGDEDAVCSGHNVSFSSETRFVFEYGGGEHFEFNGDDDLWVFVNGRLALDLGGLHGPIEAFFDLDASDGTADGSVLEFGSPYRFRQDFPFTDRDLGLVLGGVYEVRMFHAERNACGSNFKLTLRAFEKPRSICTSTCGDGVKASDEACDDGTNDGSYGTCAAGCTLAPFCGDANVDPEEACDDGANLADYGGTTQLCAPLCEIAPYCGDGNIDGSQGEQCDDGENNSPPAQSYDGCTDACELGPRCGDGLGQPEFGEACDEGVLNGTSGSACASDCSLNCGNGQLDPGEQCDDGSASNTGGYGGCNPDCSLAARCGDGVTQASSEEQCDDGRNDGSYGTCAAGCLLGPRCGDGQLQSVAGEQCDDGSKNVSSGYGTNLCLSSCRPAPRCGDGALDAANGEVCDDGVNDGAPGSCSLDCSERIELPSCGNGILDSGEECDTAGNNGSAASSCDAFCNVKCGNGVLDSGEECDDGNNDGAYGTCSTSCTLAGFCGDGVTTGPEDCDEGAGNAAAAYGPGLCTTACQEAPRCGDGRIQTDNGEECDSQGGCDSNCSWSVIR